MVQATYGPSTVSMETDISAYDLCAQEYLFRGLAWRLAQRAYVAVG